MDAMAVTIALDFPPPVGVRPCAPSSTNRYIVSQGGTCSHRGARPPPYSGVVITRREPQPPRVLI